MQTAAFFDVDGTLTSDNVWKGIMAFFAHRRERRLTHAWFLLAHYPLLLPRALGVLSETTFRRRWASHLPWYFRGFDAAQMQQLAGWVAHEFVVPLVRADVLQKLQQHARDGAVVALVSGAPTPIVQAMAEVWGVEHAIGSPAEFRGDRYTGRMAGEPCIDEYKAMYVQEYLRDKALQVDLGRSHAYADSYSDLGLLELVGHPVAVYPDPPLRELAAARGWAVIGNEKG